VIKPALWGDWASLVDFRQLFAGKIIYSSSLETGIGQRAGIALALSDPACNAALGYGVDGLFEADGLGLCSHAEAIWTAL
ncbi:MAG TPA: hypothetical protein PLV25_00125, partial [Opitutales bacterium]|nr:hypothetical protein [Opitutales bacterium]